MKKIFILSAIVAMAFLSACDKDSPGDNYDFSNSVSQYAALSNTDSVDAVEGDSLSVRFLIRTAFNQADAFVTVTYNVSGAVELTDQTVVIKRNALNANAKIWIPDGLVTDPDPDAYVEAIVSLTKAVTSTGEQLRIGQYDDPSVQKLRVKIYQP